VLSFLFFAKELLSEDKKEIIDENPQNHGRFHGIELLHGETPEGKILFQFLDRVFIVCPGFTESPYLIG